MPHFDVYDVIDISSMFLLSEKWISEFSRRFYTLLCISSVGQSRTHNVVDVETFRCRFHQNVIKTELLTNIETLNPNLRLVFGFEFIFTVLLRGISHLRRRLLADTRIHSLTHYRWPRRCFTASHAPWISLIVAHTFTTTGTKWNKQICAVLWKLDSLPEALPF